MMTWVAVAAGGAAGSVLRYGVSVGMYALLGRSFPIGTLSVNVLGSFLIGLFYVLMMDRWMLAAEWRMAILVGVLGGFTTFSSFSLETLQLLEQSQPGLALLNVLLNISLCLLACWLGLWMGRQFG